MVSSFWCLRDDFALNANIDLNTAAACFFVKKGMILFAAPSWIPFVSHAKLNEDRRAMI